MLIFTLNAYLAFCVKINKMFIFIKTKIQKQKITSFHSREMLPKQKKTQP